MFLSEVFVSLSEFPYVSLYSLTILEIKRDENRLYLLKRALEILKSCIKILFFFDKIGILLQVEKSE